MQITKMQATYQQNYIKARKTDETDEKETVKEDTKDDAKVNGGFDFNAILDKKQQEQNLERLENLKLFSQVNIIDAQSRNAKMIERMSTSMLSMLDDTTDLADLFFDIANNIPDYGKNPDKKPVIDKDKDKDKVNEEEKVDETEGNDKTDETDEVDDAENVGEVEETEEAEEAEENDALADKRGHREIANKFSLLDALGEAAQPVVAEDDEEDNTLMRLLQEAIETFKNSYVSAGGLTEEEILEQVIDYENKTAPDENANETELKMWKDAVVRFEDALRAENAKKVEERTKIKNGGIEDIFNS